MALRRGSGHIGTGRAGAVSVRLLALLPIAGLASGCSQLAELFAVGVVAPIVVPAAAAAASDSANPAPHVDAATAAAVTERVRIYSKDDPQVRGSNPIGEGKALSCKRKLNDPPASEAEALVNLRLVAEQSGGNAVILKDCDATGDVSLSKNCYSWVRCEGTIIHMTAAPHETAGDNTSRSSGQPTIHSNGRRSQS